MWKISFSQKTPVGFENVHFILKLREETKFWALTLFGWGIIANFRNIWINFLNFWFLLFTNTFIREMNYSAFENFDNQTQYQEIVDMGY